jgi:uncharacterized protein YjbI with pentapeptide repeats
MNEKFSKERAKATAQGVDEKAWILNLLASDWEADQGRLVLKGAELQEANLFRANLQGAHLSGANLQGAIYEPTPGALLDILMLRTARNLETLRFRGSPHALEELK